MEVSLFFGWKLKLKCWVGVQKMFSVWSGLSVGLSVHAPRYRTLFFLFPPKSPPLPSLLSFTLASLPSHPPLVVHLTLSLSPALIHASSREQKRNACKEAGESEFVHSRTKLNLNHRTDGPKVPAKPKAREEASQHQDPYPH